MIETATELQRTLPPAMEGIVEDVQLQNTNYLTFNRVYSKVGSTGVISADPAIIHFGGFELNKVFKQTLRIKNVSGTGTRIHIVPPTTPFFKAWCNNKKGLVAPGLDEEIEVEFCPQEWRYYYDCVRIHSEEENLLIPIHAYPIMNQTKFPKRIDFGKCAIGEVLTKRVKMECKVPIEFEFQISELKQNPCFRVEPMRGIVPAHGHVVVEINFSPVDLRTEELTLQVQVSEFNSEPVVCSITGSGFPGVARERLLQQATGSKLPTMEMLDGTRTLKVAQKTWSTNLGGGTARGGAGGGDAYTNLIMSERKQAASLRDCRKTGPITARLPKIQPPPAEVEVGRVFYPDSLLQTQGEVAYVLNQEPGKLRIKCIKDAIDTKKMELAEQQEALNQVMSEGLDRGVHPLERPEIPAAIKEALFRMQLSQAEEADKRVSLGSHVVVGQDVLPLEDVEEARRLREGQFRQHQLSLELQATQRLEPELEACGALHLPGAPSTSYGQQQQPSDGSGPGPAADGLEGYRPEWRLLEANDWRKRVASLQRFIEAVRRVVFNARIRKRLDKIRDVLGQLGHSKQRIAEEAANPVLLVMESDRPGSAPAKYLKPEMVRTRPLPVYRDALFTDHAPVAESHYTDFDELAPMSSKVPLEFKILGYKPEDYPGLTPYAPPLLDQPLMDGAQEEHPYPSASGVVPDPSTLPAMPDSCKQMPFVTLEVGNRYSDDKVYALPEPSWGMDAAYRLQPKVFPLHDSMQHDSLPSGSVRALRGLPLLSERWLPRRDTWQIQLTNEVVPELLSGPDPADKLTDSRLDADKPQLVIPVPSDDLIAKYLPQQAPAADAGATTSQDLRYELLRQKRQDEVDAAKRSAHTQALAAYEAKLAEYNKGLGLPCHYALELAMEPTPAMETWTRDC